MFKESDIPSQINTLKAFKTWRMMGQKLLGAVMLGLIEYLIRRRSTLLEKEILIVPQQNRQLIELIKASSNKDGQQRVKYIYDELEIMDKRNQLANELAQAYLQKKGVAIQPANYETQMKLFASEFDISIQIHSQTIQKYYGKANVSSLIFYESERNYYFILKIAQECMHCQAKEELVKLKCEHNICKTCLEQFFGASKISSVKCEETGCYFNISKDFYLQSVNKSQSKIQTQQSQIIKEYSCNLCNSKKAKESIFHLSCRHNLCKPCVLKHIQNAKSLKQSCLMEQCPGKFVMEDFTELKKTLTYSEKQSLESTSKIIQKKEVTEQNIQNEQKAQSNVHQQKEEQNSQIKAQQTDSQIQSKENTAEVKQIEDELNTIQNQKCSRCKAKCFEAMFKSNCLHYYCEDCCEILNEKYFNFFCLEYGCEKNIKTGTMIFIGKQEKNTQQQEIKKELPPQKCSRCAKKFNVSELFYSQCCHYVCFSCIDYMINNRKILQCPYCKIRLDQSSIEDYYLEQQTQLLKRISVEEQTNSQEQKFEYQYVEKLNECECCHSPFTEYNIQQDLTCHNHSIGTCCIVFPVDCPKCQLGSITIHKSRLKFELQVMEEEFTN